MTQVTCPGCGTTMDNFANPCPACGYKKDPAFTRKVLQFVALFAILGALWLCFLLLNAGEKKPAPGPPLMPGESRTVEAP